MMQFLGFGAAAAKPEPEEYVIPSESALIEALLTAYRNPAIMTTEAMQLEVSARHPTWTVSLKRVRKLLCKVVAQHDADAWVACGEDEVEDWCVIRAPVVVQKAASVSALWAARLRQGESSVQVTKSMMIAPTRHPVMKAAFDRLMIDNRVIMYRNRPL